MKAFQVIFLFCCITSLRCQELCYDTISYPIIRVDRVCDDYINLSSRIFYYDSTKTLERIEYFDDGNLSHTIKYIKSGNTRIQIGICPPGIECALAKNIYSCTVFDSLNRPIKKGNCKIVDGDSTCKSTVQYFYENERLKKEERGSFTNFYSYNQKGQLIKLIHSFGDKASTTFYKYRKDKLVNKTEINSEGKINIRIKYKYQNGRISKKKRYKDRRALIYETVYSYRNGLLTKITETDILAKKKNIANNYVQTSFFYLDGRLHYMLVDEFRGDNCFDGCCGRNDKFFFTYDH